MGECNRSRERDSVSEPLDTPNRKTGELSQPREEFSLAVTGCAPRRVSKLSQLADQVL